MIKNKIKYKFNTNRIYFSLNFAILWYLIIIYNADNF